MILNVVEFVKLQVTSFSTCTKEGVYYLNDHVVYYLNDHVVKRT